MPSVSIFSNSPTSINLSPAVSQLNSSYIKISNLNKTSSALIIPTQNINITLTNIKQPNSARSISNFGMSIYYGI
jgi:hypothetical protein